MKEFINPLRYLLAVFSTAVVGQLALTLSDWAQRLDPDGTTADIAEVLKDTNEILMDMLWVESNQPTSHVSTIRTGYPTGTWRMFNYGVSQEKSRTVQITDGMGMLETYSTVDKAIADLNGNTAEFRFSEDQAFLEGMNQSFADVLFYGSAAEPNKFIGLANRMDGTPQATDDTLSTYNILSGGGNSNANTSMWLISWGPNTVFGVFPKGQKAGLSSRDLGEDTVYDENNNPYQAYRTHYKWDGGLVVKNWRYLVRIANIDAADLATFGAGTDNSAPLIRLMIEAVNRIPSMGMGKMVFYCNRTVHTWLEIMASEKVNVNLTMMNYGGEKIVGFRGIPIRRCDAILDTEANVA